MLQKLKSFLLDDVVFYTILLVSVALVAFLLGRQSINELAPNQAGVQIIQNTALVTDTESVSSETIEGVVAVVASRSGTKYHLQTCPGAKQIKEANKITFSSIEEAKAAGYTAAANCKGFQE